MAVNRQPVLKRCRTLGINPATMGIDKSSNKNPKQGRKKQSEYGLQLNEKQKVKFIYGVLEKQFRKYYVMATKRQGITGEMLLQILESRLDNVVFRLGLANTRREARQIVNHGHITVNGQKVDIPSYLVKPGDEISIAPTSKKLTLVQSNLEPYSKNNNCEPWLSLDTTEMKGKFISVPERSDVRELEKINEQLIVELYSR